MAMTAWGTYGGRPAIETGVRRSIPSSAIRTPSWLYSFEVWTGSQVRIWATEGQAAHRFCQEPQATPTPRKSRNRATSRLTRGRQYGFSQAGGNASQRARRALATAWGRFGASRVRRLAIGAALDPAAGYTGSLGAGNRPRGCSIYTSSPGGVLDPRA